MVVFLKFGYTISCINFGVIVLDRFKEFCESEGWNYFSGGDISICIFNFKNKKNCGAEWYTRSVLISACSFNFEK